MHVATFIDKILAQFIDQCNTYYDKTQTTNNYDNSIVFYNNKYCFIRFLNVNE